jgi:hypothetical protein
MNYILDIQTAKHGTNPPKAMRKLQKGLPDRTNYLTSFRQ